MCPVKKSGQVHSSDERRSLTHAQAGSPPYQHRILSLLERSEGSDKVDWQYYQHKEHEVRYHNERARVQPLQRRFLILVLPHNIPGVRGTRDASGVVSVSIATPYTCRQDIGDRRSNSVFHSLALRSSPSPSVASCRERGVQEFS